MIGRIAVLKSQKGVTLLEVIIATAILGMLVSYAGSQVFKLVKNNHYSSSADKIVSFQNKIKQYSTETIIETNTGDFVANKLLTETTTGIVKYNDLLWIKGEHCKPSGIAPDAKNPIIGCDYDANLNGIEYVGTTFDFVELGLNYLASTNVDEYRRIKRYPKSSTSEYVSVTNLDSEDFLGVISRLASSKRDDGYRLDPEQIVILYYTFSGGRYVADESKTWTFTSLINDINLYNTIIVSKPRDSYLGVKVSSFYNSDVFLKRDGSIPISQEGSLCWDGKSGIPAVCLSSITSDDGDKYLRVDGDVIFTRGEKNLSPVVASYHTFKGKQPVDIPFIKCPASLSGPSGNLIENRMVALTSSFSSGTRAGTDFSNPAALISKGTGDGEKHGYITGLSLEWDKLGSNAWRVNGSIAFDSSYNVDEAPDGYLKNPPGISFIVLQWCED
ncbi:MAG: type II secretion system protein [Vibrio sp.]